MKRVLGGTRRIAICAIVPSPPSRSHRSRLRAVGIAANKKDEWRPFGDRPGQKEATFPNAEINSWDPRGNPLFLGVMKPRPPRHRPQGTSSSRRWVSSRGNVDFGVKCKIHGLH